MIDASARRVLLGIDTGGTYTDAVLLDAEGAARPHAPDAVLARAKALTTRDDLARGIGDAVGNVLTESGIAPGQIAMASLSTTLATNALVEGQGDPAALVFIGFGERDLARSGLAEAVGADPVFRISGGHDVRGDEAAPLDSDALRGALAGVSEEVRAVAVAGYFAVRNPDHERRAMEIVREVTGLPVTGSHELTSRIGGPKRALTTLLNARLIGLIDRLIAGASDRLDDLGLSVPLMIVRGDGALVAADFARNRPIETILSGPAASLVGARFLTGLRDAVVSDIGGTTTDIAVLKDARPELDPEGAEVGGVRTLVEAVAMRTHGLGGDSIVGLSAEGLVPRMTLGPRRAVPVSLLADTHPDRVLPVLRVALTRTRGRSSDGVFYIARDRVRPSDPSDVAEILARLEAGPLSADSFDDLRGAPRLLSQLIDRGRVQISAFTPTDASHVTGRHGTWHVDAARMAAELLARQKTGSGVRAFPSAVDVSAAVIDALCRRSAEVVLSAALSHDGFDGEEALGSLVVQAGLSGHEGVASLPVGLTMPLIGLGASSPTYYPDVARRLRTRDATPPDAAVANAVGAVVGQVIQTRSVLITCPSEGRYIVHDGGDPRQFDDEGAAVDAARQSARSQAEGAARAAGAATSSVTDHLRREVATVEGREMVVEIAVTATASGRPRFAD
ncbi:MAG: hydantoinase/oxoprolinase family protein [Pseudomonadota bacterium]